MDENMKSIRELRNKRLEKNFKKHNMNILFFKNATKLQSYIKEKLMDKSSVSVGGSMTLFETGIIDVLEKADITYYNRYEEGLDYDQIQEVFRKAFSCDVYITSTNALSEDGYLYNIDGNGNRVAAMIYGPKEVLVIAGTNKICEDEESARKRIRHLAAPANNTRLHKNNPCVKTGVCMDCNSPERICSSFVKLGYQGNKNRITICMIEEEYGY